MKLSRQFLAASAASFALSIGALPADVSAADAFPSRPITIVVSAAPGGSPDILARIIAPALSARLGQSVVIDNKPGGAGNIAAGYVARSAPDGHTLLVATDSLSINQTLFQSLPFHAVKSFSPVINLISSPQVFAVNSEVPVKSVKEFVAAAKASPEKFALASPAIGTTGQLGVLLFQNQADIKVKPVVYRSAQPALVDVLGKHADGIIVTIAPALEFIKAGKLRALGVSTAKRSPSLPDVPTFVEQGYPNFNFESWQGLVAAANTPPAIVERLNRELNAVLREPAIRAALEKQAFEPQGGTPEALGKIIAVGIDTWADVIHANQIRVD